MHQNQQNTASVLERANFLVEDTEIIIARCGEYRGRGRCSVLEEHFEVVVMRGPNLGITKEC